MCISTKTMRKSIFSQEQKHIILEKRCKCFGGFLCMPPAHATPKNWKRSRKTENLYFSNLFKDFLYGYVSKKNPKNKLLWGNSWLSIPSCDK